MTAVMMEEEEDDAPLTDVEILTENLLKMVDVPEAVWVEEKPERPDSTLLVIHVDERDRGRVIGSKGANINLLRNLMGIFAARQRKRISIEVAGDKPSRMRARL